MIWIYVTGYVAIIVGFLFIAEAVEDARYDRKFSRLAAGDNDTTGGRS